MDIVRVNLSRCNCPTSMKLVLLNSLHPLFPSAFPILCPPVLKPFVPQVHQILFELQFRFVSLLQPLPNHAAFLLLSLLQGVLLRLDVLLLSLLQACVLLPIPLLLLPRTPLSCELPRPQSQLVWPFRLPII